jgi:ribosomal protein S18 acetylase RimI-like enzyme
MFNHRPVIPEDFEIISRFPQNQTELFFMYPKGIFPLTARQLEEAASNRIKPTVITYQGQVIGYGNLYDVTREDCWLGNIIISPSCRGIGAGSYLIRTMIEIAKQELHVKYLRLVCHNINTDALLLYTKLGFLPMGLKMMNDPIGKQIVGIKMEIHL